MVVELEPGVSSAQFRKLWVLATALSIAIGLGLLYAADPYAFDRFMLRRTDNLDILGLAILLVGILPGLAQWLVLRQYLARAGWWILTTAGGLVFSLLLAYVGYRLFSYIGEQLDSSVISWLIIIVLVVFIIFFYVSVMGVLQWLILRKQIPESRKWISISQRAWGIGIGLGLVIGVILYLITTVVLMIDALLGLFDLYYHVGTELIYALVIAEAGGVIGGIAAWINGKTLVNFLIESPANEQNSTFSSQAENDHEV